MRAHLLTVAIAVVSVAFALALFFAGYFARGWVDEAAAAGANQRVVQVAPSTATPQAAAAPTAAASPVTLNVDGRPFRGSEGAPVTIVEFSDFQCTFCKSYVDQTLPLVLSTYGSRVRYVFWNFPISQLHPQAAKAAEAAMCAGDQGKFWEYHDLLFQNQGALDASSLKSYARNLGMDGGAFDSCLNSGKYTAAVQKDFDEGRADGVTGTPTFFVNGRKLVGAQPFAAFQRVIEDELTRASAGSGSARGGG